MGKLKTQKLTALKVSIIKRLLSEGGKPEDIMDKFNICRATVSDIKTGRTWAHV